jgi:hypothetical protein
MGMSFLINVAVLALVIAGIMVFFANRGNK